MPSNVRAERPANRVRSSRLFDANPCDLTTLRDRQLREQIRNEGAQIRDAVGSSTKHDDRDGETRQVLLKGRLRSTVTNASNSCSVRVRSSPFFNAAQPA